LYCNVGSPASSLNRLAYNVQKGKLLLISNILGDSGRLDLKVAYERRNLSKPDYFIIKFDNYASV